MSTTASDTSRSRGKNSGDDKLFGGPKMQARLKSAVEDLSLLLSRGYPPRSSLALVGNRHRLNVRQQKAVQGMSAAVTQVAYRNQNSMSLSGLRGKHAAVDGFNVLILLESMLSGAYLFKGMDGFYRDLSSVHGSYKKVKQTTGAIQLVAQFYKEAGLTGMHWYFDKPVSNSGRLKQLIEETAQEQHCHWEVTLSYAPDKDIAASSNIAITSDAWVLDQAAANFNLLHYALQKFPQASIIRLFD